MLRKHGNFFGIVWGGGGNMRENETELLTSRSLACAAALTIPKKLSHFFAANDVFFYDYRESNGTLPQTPLHMPLRSLGPQQKPLERDRESLQVVSARQSCSFRILRHSEPFFNCSTIPQNPTPST